MRRSRTGRLVIALAVLVLLAFGAVVAAGEWWMRPAVERQIAQGIERELGLSAEPSVRVRGFPIVVRAVQERIDGIDITAEGETFEGLRVERLDLRVEHVEFDTGELLGRSGNLTISGGDGDADVTDADLTAYLASVGVPIHVRFVDGVVRASGSVSFGGLTAEAAVSGGLSLAGDRLRFTPSLVDAASFRGLVDLDAVDSALRAHFAFEAPVPALRGVRLTGVEIGDGLATITADFETLHLSY